jgi:hypothetical protein
MAIAAASALTALAVAGTANAGVLVAGAPSCDSQVFSRPFLPWADQAQYTLQPGGSFEQRAREWKLEGADIADGNEPYYVTSSGDSRSLSIPAGATATSGAVCVGIEHPDIRFFARGSNALARLKVEVLFEDAAGNVQSAPIGVVNGTKDWTLTPPLAIVANLLALLPGNHTAVAFRFSAGAGDFSIDDVYVDPIQRW